MSENPTTHASDCHDSVHDSVHGSVKDILLKNALFWSSKGSQKADILLSGGKIAAVGVRASELSRLTDREPAWEYDVTGKWVLPGIIDSQVHFREPGLVHKEDIATGSKAALLGGVTTFLEMPNTSPPTTSVKALMEKLDIAAATSYVNYGFFIGATADNLPDLKDASKQVGCCGIKIFLGSSTGDLLLYDRQVLKEIFLATDLPISIHSEDEELLRQRISIRDEGKSSLDHLQWRDEEVAFRSTQMIVELARECGRKIHILHISSKREMEYLAQHKDILTVEATPQHLTLYAPACYEKLGSLAQMNPPIRSMEHREALWEGLSKGVVDVIGSDHAPHTREEKAKAYPGCPSGMPGVQTLLQVMLYHVNNGRLSMERLISLICENPAARFSLAGKGHIKEGYDADITIVDPEQECIISDAAMASKTGWTPFAGMEVKAGIFAVIVAGEMAVMEGKILKEYGKKRKNFVKSIVRH